MNHLQLAFRNLERRPARSILTALGVALAVGSFITLYGLSRSVYQNVQQSIEEHGSDLTVRRRGTAELFGGTIPETNEPRIAEIPGVVAVSGDLLSLAATDQDAQVLAAGWPDDSFYWQNVPLEEGRLPQRGERKVALMGIDLARVLQKHAGDTIGLLGEQFKIIAITRFNSVINRNLVIVPLADLQELTFRPGALTFLSVKLAHPGDPAEVDRVSKAIEAASDLSATKSENVLRNDSMIGLLRAVSAAMAWVALLMGVLMVLNTLAHGGAGAHARDRHSCGDRLVERPDHGGNRHRGLHFVGHRQRCRYRHRRCRVASVECNSGHRTIRCRAADTRPRRRDGLGGNRVGHSWFVLSGLACHQTEPRRCPGTRLISR